MRYAIVIEKAKRNYAAYVPDLPGCVATGRTRAEVHRQIRQAIQFHIEGLRADGLPIPKASTILGISRPTLDAKIKTYELKRE
jgi:predicted RNase H-like HicB family nuclease